MKLFFHFSWCLIFYCIHFHSFDAGNCVSNFSFEWMKNKIQYTPADKASNRKTMAQHWYHPGPTLRSWDPLILSIGTLSKHCLQARSAFNLYRRICRSALVSAPDISGHLWIFLDVALPDCKDEALAQRLRHVLIVGQTLIQRSSNPSLLVGSAHLGTQLGVRKIRIKAKSNVRF